MTESPSPRSSQPVLWSIEDVRTCSVLAVVTFHAWTAAAVFMTPALLLGPPRQFGLDAFFVLSGFLVWQVTRRRESRPTLFFLHRVTRIAPMYTIATLAYAAFLLSKPAVRIDADATVTPQHLVLSLLYIPHLSASGAETPLLGPGWTLVYDMFYFLLFALVLLWPPRRQLLAATALFVAPGILHFVFDPKEIVAQVYTHPRCLGFLAGVWIAEGYERRRLLPARLAQAMVSLAIALYLGLFAASVQYHGFGAALWMLAAISVVYGTVSIEAAGARWLRIPYASAIGRWSFGIYLVQALAIPVAILVVPGPVWVRSLAAVGLSIVGGKILHERVEAPVNRALKKFEVRRGLGGMRTPLIAP